MYHTRIMKCTLEIEHSRAYWQLCEQIDGPVSVEHAFERAIFGNRTYLRVEGLVADMRHRFDAFPIAFNVLKQWPTMVASDLPTWQQLLLSSLGRRVTLSQQILIERRAAA